MSAFTFETASVSRTGGRDYNEDACAHRGHCWVLADGLGGHGGGEVASAIAVETVLRVQADTTPTAAGLAQAVRAANDALRKRQQAEQRLTGMRTTLVILASDGAMALWAHVGDSRLYHFRGGELASQTEDHSVPQALAKAGEISPAEIRHHEDRNRLLRTLGADEEPRPTVLPGPVPLARSDAFLLCTDGFWEYVTEQEMEVDLHKAATPEEWLDFMVGRLMARAEPDNDNYTAMAVLVQ
jgi:PPM family protein phosphatase